jgi:Family of unknown function (DUF5317)
VIVVLLVIGLAIGVGFVAGGSLAPFGRLQIHWWGAALVGLVMQGIPATSGLGRTLGPILLVASYALLLAFALVNRRLRALWLVIAGLAANLLVIGVNGGMPVSTEALRDAGLNPARLGDAGTLKHHLMGPEDSLTPLADVIAIPQPVGAVVSIGDVALYLGVAALVVSVMLGRSGENRRPPARWFPGYRGKHLPPERRFARGARPTDPSGGAHWGTGP